MKELEIDEWLIATGVTNMETGDNKTYFRIDGFNEKGDDDNTEDEEASDGKAE